MELVGLFLIHLVLAAILARHLHKKFGGGFLSAFMISSLFTIWPLLIVYVVFRRHVRRLRDDWEPIEFEVPAYVEQLPLFIPPAEENVPVDTSLKSLIYSDVAELDESVSAFVKSWEMRKLRDDKRAYNKRLFDFADERVADLNASIKRKVFRYLETGMLAQTIEVDDHIDLRQQKVSLDKFVFHSPDEQPLQRPPALELRPEPFEDSVKLPFFVKLMPGSLRRGMVGEILRRDREIWLEQKDLQTQRQEILDAVYRKAEEERQSRLAMQRSRFDDAMAEFSRLALSHNSKLDMEIQGFHAGDKASVEKYIGRVLSSSRYFSELRPEAQLCFDEATQELQVSVLLPPLSSVEGLAIQYKVSRARGDAEETPVSRAELKRLYGSAVMQIMLRTAHEISEADRSKTIRSFSVLGQIRDNISGAKVVVATLAGVPEEFVAKNLKGEVSSLFSKLGGTISKDPGAGVAVNLKGTIRGK